MLRLLQKLIFGHVHEWEIHREVPYQWSNDFGEHGNCVKYTLRCKHCGAMKVFLDR